MTNRGLQKPLINASKKKNELYRTFIRNRSKNAENKYKTNKNKLTFIVQFSEKQYYAHMLERNRRNTKVTWSIVKSIIKKKSCQNGIPNIFTHKGRFFKGYSDIPNGFSKYVVNVGSNLAKQIDVHEHKDISDYMNDRNVNSMFLSPVIEAESKV